MYAAELVSLHRGQGLELLWRDSLQCPTESQYIAMVNDSKYCVLITITFGHLYEYHVIETGGLFRVAVKLMMACATTNVNVYVLQYPTVQNFRTHSCEKIVTMSRLSTSSGYIFRFGTTT